MGIGNLNGSYQHLLVAPTSLKPAILRMIERETENRSDGYIFIKVNSLTDLEVMYALQRASEAGVNIIMMIRGICCMLPQIEGVTDNIQIFSVVGRFLEHSRIYVFGKDHRLKVYISSADLMTRNTERRVEVACPVYAEHIRKKIFNYIDSCLADNAKARILTNTGDYVLRDGNNHSINYQELMIENTYEEEITYDRMKMKKERKTSGFFGLIRKVFRNSY